MTVDLNREGKKKPATQAAGFFGVSAGKDAPLPRPMPGFLNVSAAA